MPPHNYHVFLQTDKCFRNTSIFKNGTKDTPAPSLLAPCSLAFLLSSLFYSSLTKVTFLYLSLYDLLFHRRRHINMSMFFFVSLGAFAFTGKQRFCPRKSAQCEHKNGKPSRNKWNSDTFAPPPTPRSLTG